MSGAKQNFQLAAAQIYQSSALQRFGKYEDRLKIISTHSIHKLKI